MAAVQWSEEMSRSYAGYMERNVKHDHRRFAARIAADWPELPAEMTVLDLAGGPGFLIGELAPFLEAPRLIVTDDSEVMMSVARERAKAKGLSIEVEHAPADKLPFADSSIDLVICKHFLRFAVDLTGVLCEARRVLKPGGRAYFIDFNAEGPYLGKRLLWLLIKLTGPKFLSESFWESMGQGLAATSVRDRLVEAGFSDAAILRSSVSYLIRAVK